jgi:DNA integrity scanning protein DisA with diadenylate cyclase activity
VIGGFVTLAALYVAARLLDMYLTLLVFQALITVALVAVVVIFQEDIRRGFERIALRGRLHRERGPAESELANIVVEAAAELAKRKIGALFVLRGKEPLERHVTGGVLLDGRPSETLFYSIFDPHSAGHDGAVLIESGLVRRFGAHLPLSTRPPPKLGTRHTAALGLSERSDAFVIVVSEERGTISVARAGELSVISPGELKSRLDAFVGEVSPERPRRLFLENPGTKALSLAIAVGAWLALFGPDSETIARSYTVPIVYRDVPDGWLLEEPNPPEARVTLTGPARAFDLLDPGSLTISLHVGEVRPGAHRLPLDDADLNQPRELAIHRIDPGSVLVAAHQTDLVELPVAPTLVGSLTPPRKLIRTSISPERVQVALQRSERGKVTKIPTEPLDLARLESTTSVTRALRAPKGVLLPRGAPTEARVTVEIAK